MDSHNVSVRCVRRQLISAKTPHTFLLCAPLARFSDRLVQESSSTAFTSTNSTLSSTTTSTTLLLKSCVSSLDHNGMMTQPFVYSHGCHHQVLSFVMVPAMLASILGTISP